MKRKAKAAGKKAAVRKPARKAAPRPAAPVAAKQSEQQYPCNALVSKGGDKLPVQVKDAAHLAKLREEHGEASVEVLS